MQWVHTYRVLSWRFLSLASSAACNSKCGCSASCIGLALTTVHPKKEISCYFNFGRGLHSVQKLQAKVPGRYFFADPRLALILVCVMVKACRLLVRISSILFRSVCFLLPPLRLPGREMR